MSEEDLGCVFARHFPKHAALTIDAQTLHRTQHTSSTSISSPALGPRSEDSLRPNSSSSIWKQMPAIAGS